MVDLTIRRLEAETDETGNFIHREFVRYGEQHHVTLNYDEFCFAAESGSGDLIVGEAYRRSGLGSRLVAAVEDAFRGKGYDVVTLTTFGFQAPDFYRKLGYTVEFVRDCPDPKLRKYFMVKKL